MASNPSPQPPPSYTTSTSDSHNQQADISLLKSKQAGRLDACSSACLSNIQEETKQMMGVKQLWVAILGTAKKLVEGRVNLALAKYR